MPLCTECHCQRANLLRNSHGNPESGEHPMQIAQARSLECSTCPTLKHHFRSRNSQSVSVSAINGELVACLGICLSLGSGSGSGPDADVIAQQLHHIWRRRSRHMADALMLMLFVGLNLQSQTQTQPTAHPLLETTRQTRPGFVIHSSGATGFSCVWNSDYICF